MDGRCEEEEEWVDDLQGRQKGEEWVDDLQGRQKGEAWVDDLQGRQKGEESGEVRTIGVLVESGVTEGATSWITGVVTTVLATSGFEGLGFEEEEEVGRGREEERLLSISSLRWATSLRRDFRLEPAMSFFILEPSSYLIGDSIGGGWPLWPCIRTLLRYWCCSMGRALVSTSAIWCFVLILRRRMVPARIS